MYETARTQLVPFTTDYAEAYGRWRNNPEIIRYEQSGSYWPLNETQISDWINRISQSENSHSMIIIEKATNKPIGFCAYMNIDHKNRNMELAITIGEQDRWNQGFAKEVMRWLIDNGFAQFNMHKIYLRVANENTRAIRVYEACGFTLEATMKEVIWRDGHYIDTLLYSIFEKE